MDTKYFEEYLQQFTDWQKKFLDTWLNSVPNGKNVFKIPENMDKSLDFQQELVDTYLKAQETAMNTALETQKKFWEGYFELIRKASVAKVEPA